MAKSQNVNDKPVESDYIMGILDLPNELLAGNILRRVANCPGGAVDVWKARGVCTKFRDLVDDYVIKAEPRKMVEGVIPKGDLFEITNDFDWNKPIDFYKSIFEPWVHAKRAFLVADAVALDYKDYLERRVSSKVLSCLIQLKRSAVKKRTSF